MRPRNHLVLLTLALVLLVPHLVMAAVPVHNFPCERCHTVGTVNDLQTGNMCLTCHDGPVTVAMNRDPSARSDAKFSSGDASNRFGNNPTFVEQVSHHWAAGSVNLAAGAGEPNKSSFPGLYSRQGATAGKVACSRCHQVHGDKITNPTLMPDTAVRYVPMAPNDLCLACHATFKTLGLDPTNHGLISHPIGMDYVATAAARNAAAPPGVTLYNSGTLLSGEIALMGDGTVSCLTCHGVHATDSDADTVDGFAAGSNPGVGDGLLLKHNGPGREDPANSASLCQACHNYTGHGMDPANPSPLGCMVCHGGHEYDANANYFMLKKKINLPSADMADGDGNVFLDYTSIGSHYNTATTPNGSLCFSCHSFPVGHLPDAACADCHGHDQASGSFAAGCGSCHGYAPSAVDPSGPNGYAVSTQGPAFNNYSTSGVWKDESATPHAAHANGAGNYSFACQSCHGTGAGVLGSTDHDNGLFQQVINTAIGGLPDLTTANSQISGTPSYNDRATAGNCTAVYCHSNGRVYRAPENVQPVQTAAVGPWKNGADTISTCTVCHDVKVLGTKGHSPTHEIHLAKGYACGVCHNDTSADGSTLVAGAIGGTHVNGVVDAVFSGIAANLPVAMLQYDDTAGTCANYCHSSGQSASPAPVTPPDWDLANTGECGDCHGTSTASPASLSGSHNAHFDAGVTTCSDCHTHDGAFGVVHIDGNIDLTANACNACHGATAGQTVGADRIPVWGDSTSVDCATCHTGSAISVIGVLTGANSYMDVAAFYTTGHGDNGLTGAPDCLGCHDAAATGHFDGDSIDDRLISAAATNDAFCNSCHTNERVHYNDAANTPDNSKDGDSCYLCHNPHGEGMGSNTDVMLIVGENFSDKTNPTSYYNATTFKGVCQTCHIAADGVGGIDHYNQTTSDGHNSGTVCTQCHSHTATPAFSASCTDCHGNATTGNYWPDSVTVGIDAKGDAYPNRLGAHAEHIDAISAQMTGGATLANKNLTCDYCHPGGGHSGDQLAAPADLMSGANKFKNILGVANVQTSIVTQDGGTNVSCATVDCHYTTTMPQTNWYAAGSQANCNYCHTVADSPYAGGLPDAHAKHMSEKADGGRDMVCTNCHATAGSTAHQNGVIDFSTGVAPLETTLTIDTAIAAGTKLGPKYGAAGAIAAEFSTCANLYCHGEFTGGDNTNDPNWFNTDAQLGVDLGDGACGTCHGTNALATPSSNKHGVHLGNTTYVDGSCAECHTNTTTHVDGTVDLVGAANVVGASTCTNLCHTLDGVDNDVLVTTDNPSWLSANTNKLGCEDCHVSGKTWAGAGGALLTRGLPPSSGKHAEHMANSSYVLANCTDCHSSNTVTHSALDNVVEVGGAKVSTYTTPNCTNSCHAPATVSWTAGTVTCTDCHVTGTYIGSGTNLPTSGLHNVTPTISGQKHDQSVTGGCAACHNTLAAKVTHIDGTFTGDTMANLGLQYYTQSAADAGDCTTSCHTTLSGDWAHEWNSTAGYYTTATTSCAGCHGDWNQNWNSGVTHRTTAATQSMHGTGTTYQCKDCHALEATSNNYIFAFGSNDWGGTSEHGNGIIEVNSNTATYDPATGICATCHTATGVDGVHNFLDTSWPIAAIAGDSINATCGSCHTGGKSTSGSSGAHDQHGANLADETTCYPCHGNNAGAGYAVYTGSHSTGSVNFAAVDYSTATRNVVTGTCNTTACHNQGASGTDESSAWNSTALACDDCHYYAASPASASNLVANANYIGGSHNAHFDATAITSCNQCHPNNSTDTADPLGHITAGTLTARANPVADNAALTPLGAAFNDPANTCNNAACHNPSPGAAYASNAWGTANTGCVMCHGDDGTVGVISSNSHDEHLGAAGTFGIDPTCTSCHESITDPAHMGTTVKLVQIAYNSATLTVASPTALNGCGTNDCHNNGVSLVTGTPAAYTWGTAVGDCVTCHDNSTTTFTNAHNEHKTGYTTTACTDCHTAATAATHINKSVNIDAAKATYSLGATVAVGTTPSGTCSTASCHNNGAAYQPAQSIAWNVATGTVAGTTDLTCNSCHGDATAGLTTSHGDHITAGKACTTCHTVPTTTTHINGKASLADGAVASAGEAAVSIAGSTAYTWSSPTCTNTSNNGLGCHATGTPSWGTAFASSACTECHTNTTTAAVNPTSGLHGVVPSVTGVTHDDAFGSGGTCASCHTVPTFGTHKDGTFTGNGFVAANKTAMGLGTMYTATGDNTGTCSATGCHFEVNAGVNGSSDDWPHQWNSTTNYYTTSPSACNGCHDDNLASANLGNTAGVDHNAVTKVHNTVTTNYSCKDCHNLEASTGYTFTFGSADWNPATTETSTHGDGNIQVNSNGTGYSRGGATPGYCSGCHTNGAAFQFSSTGWALVSVAGDGIVATCGSCHQGGVTTTGESGAHAAHLATSADLAADSATDCLPCHGNNGGAGYATTGGTHGDTLLTLVGPGYSAAKGVLTGTCSTATCHFSQTTPAWNTTGTTCTTCHNDGAVAVAGAVAEAWPSKNHDGTAKSANEAHSKHVGNTAYVTGANCTDCHGDNTTTHSNAFDGVAVVNAGLSYVSASGTCTNTCHAGSTADFRDANPTLVCVDCHSSTYIGNMGTGEHSKHTNNIFPAAYGTAAANASTTTAYRFNCANCHDNATAGKHKDGTTDMAAVGYAGAGGSCNANYCHSDGAGTNKTSPNWVGGSFTGDRCDECHGNSPTSNAHLVHAVGIHAEDIYTGTTGLLDTTTTPKSHGDSAVSTTINCNICHSQTVTMARNMFGSECTSCHSGNTDNATNRMAVADKSVHVDTNKQVVFNTSLTAGGFKSRAQLRNDITSVAEVNTSWTRPNGYKAATSFDAAKAAAASFTGTTCSAIACHNGNAATWAAPTGDCSACHTQLPQ